MPTLAYLGLGANLGDPIQQMLDAISALRRLPSSESLRCSSFYGSSPVGYDDQADFINCVVELETHLSAIELLDDIQVIENTLGRVRVVGNQNAPRLIDIDLLLYGDHTIDSERLTVPHPRMENRLFVIEPLLELVELAHYRSALESNDFDDQVVRRLTIKAI